FPKRERAQTSGMLGEGFTPCFAIQGGWLTFATSEAAMALSLAATAEKGSLAASSTFRTATSGAPKKLMAFAHLEWAGLAAQVSKNAPLLALTAAPAPAEGPTPAVFERGAKVYDTHCTRCHGDDGRGELRAYVSLAGNRAVQRDPPANLVQVVLGGAFPASSAGNPRPFGMPPFAVELSDDDIAAVLSYVRNAWGNSAAAVRPIDVQRWRGSVRP
ncbi:MAG TPA: cytochrome c, partial [Rubrivivax sp.]|nr:cytochrome c [Rubrivivax sp.]